MKKITTLLILLFSIGSITLFAQQHSPRERLAPAARAEKTVERLNKELTLTAQQQTDLKSWFTTHYKQQEEAFKKNREKREAMREQMQKNREQTEAQLKKILTAEQFQKYQEKEQERQKERQEQMKHRERGPQRH